VIERFVVTIEGAGWQDFEDLELPRLPAPGELVDTKYGTCLVTESSMLPNPEPYAGKIVCRMS
jgi:hypothetical protein